MMQGEQGNLLKSRSHTIQDENETAALQGTFCTTTFTAGDEEVSSDRLPA